MNITKKQEMNYLKEVAEYIESLGYEVEAPDENNRDLLDVWGFSNGRKCYIEIYVTIHRCEYGTVGYWMQGNHESEEVFLSDDPLYGLDLRFFPLHIHDYLASNTLLSHTRNGV